MKIALALLSARLPILYDPESGRLDAKRMAEYLNVPLEKLAPALGTTCTSLKRTPAAKSLQEALSSLKRSLDVLDEVHADRKMTLRWLNAPHPDLGGRTPLSVILEGHADAVEGLLVGAMWGIPS